MPFDNSQNSLRVLTKVIQFEPRAIYSLDPRQEAGKLLALDKNDETLSKIEE